MDTYSNTEESLIISEIRYRRLFETAKDGILILDAESGKIMEVNPFLINLLGYSKDTFFGKEVWELGFFKDILASRDKFVELQQKGYVRYEDLPLEASDGRRINVEFVSNVYIENNERVIQCNIRDITERKKIEAGLEKTRKELAVVKIAADEVSQFAENIINTVRDPLLVLDKDLRVVKASRSFYDFFRATSGETIGKLIYDLGNNQWDIPRLRELLETILPEKTTMDDYEVEHDFSAIGKRIMLLNARQIKSESGKEDIILLAIENITERKQDEEEIKLINEQLQELNISKDKFFSIIAHDLKSPFQGLLGLAEIIAEDASTFSPGELSELSGTMYKTASNLFALLKNLLEWAQMQKGSMSFTPAELSLSEMIAGNVQLIKARCRQKGITVINTITDPVHAYCDEKMINSVLLNLLTNAVKFTNREGTITVKAKKTENQMVEISINDTGTGMPESVIEKLFKVGERIGSQGTDGEASTGLGLLLCKEFIEKNSGEIRVESKEGTGSTFYFTLPEMAIA